MTNLVDIVYKTELPVPDDYEDDLDALKKKARNTKTMTNFFSKFKVDIDAMDYDKLRSCVYYTDTRKNKRSDVCREIRKWFMDNGLYKSDANCGSNKKKRFDG